MSVKIDFVNIDNARFLEVCRIYHQWKNLNATIKSWTSRGINFPDVISEQMVCFALDLKWNKGSKGGDATDEKGALIEIKATSNFHTDLSSFSPDTKFDRLIFLRLNQEKDTALIYDMGLDANMFKALMVNATQSVADQQMQGRRPRLSLISLIEQRGLKPVCEVDIIAREVKK